MHPSELDDEEESVELREGTRLLFDVQVSKDPAGKIGCLAINIKIAERPSPAQTHIVLDHDVEAVVTRFDSDKRSGFAETIGESAMRVIVNARRLVSRTQEPKLVKGAKLILDVCEGATSLYGINIRVADDNELPKTAMAIALETAGVANGNGHDDDDDPGDTEPSATEALYQADTAVKTKRRPRPNPAKAKPAEPTAAAAG